MRTLLLVLAACGSKEAADTSVTSSCDKGPCSDADTDADSDSDTDADADTDSDTDADVDTGPPAPFTLTSPDFLSSAGNPLQGQCAYILPDIFSCDGTNPTLEWAGVPVGTVAMLMILDDPDAGYYPHWAVINIDPSSTGFDPGISGGNSPSVLPHSTVGFELPFLNVYMQSAGAS